MDKKKQTLLIVVLTIIFILFGLLGKVLYDITSQDNIDNDKEYISIGNDYYEKLYNFLNSNSESSAKFCNVDISDSFCQIDNQINTNYQECVESSSAIYSNSLTYRSTDELVSELSKLFIDNIVDSFMLEEGVNFVSMNDKLYCLSTSTTSNYIVYTDEYEIVSYNEEGSSIEYLVRTSYYESNNPTSTKYRNIHFSLQKNKDGYKISYYGLS